jgi:hypothetical protein
MFFHNMSSSETTGNFSAAFAQYFTENTGLQLGIKISAFLHPHPPVPVRSAFSRLDYGSLRCKRFRWLDASPVSFDRGASKATGGSVITEEWDGMSPGSYHRFWMPGELRRELHVFCLLSGEFAWQSAQGLAHEDEFTEFLHYEN